MKRNVLFDVNSKQTPIGEEALKATALLYLQEALRQEEYESCAEIIDSARNLGANSDEIGKVLSDYVRGIGGGQKAKSRF